MEPSGLNGHGSISSLLPDRAIWIGADATDWRDAIRRAGDALIASGAVTHAYTDEMIATVESLGPYIVIAPGIALAHSRPSPAVLRTGLSLVLLGLHPQDQPGAEAHAADRQDLHSSVAPSRRLTPALLPRRRRSPTP